MSADVVVIGGGIAGCATAYYLRQHGLRTVIVERGRIGGQASGLAYGGLNPLTGAGIPGPTQPLAEQAFGLHATLGSTLPVGYRRRATVHLAFTADEAEGLRDEARQMNVQPGFLASLVDAGQVREIDPRLSSDVAAALMLEGTAEVDAALLTHALATASDAEIRTADATGLVCDGARAHGVRTGDGTIACGHVVLAPGPWLAGERWLGAPLGVAPLKGEILRLAASGPPIEPSIGWAGNYLTTKPDGLLWAGTTEQDAGFDAAPSEAGKAAILARVRRMLPDIGRLTVRRHTACLRPVTADGLALLGPAPDAANVYVAGGGGRKGILYAPAMGQIVASLIVGAQPCIDIAPFAPARFSRTERR